jgi:CheY-like chemotaxis protein
MASQTNAVALPVEAPDAARRLRCMIVDDNSDFVDAAAALLEGEGITVVGSASSGAEALEVLGDLRPHVTLVDVDLGEESGFDLVDQLDRAGWTDRAAVILTSAYSEQDFADMIAASPALGFVNKADLSSAAIRHLLAAQ